MKVMDRKVSFPLKADFRHFMPRTDLNYIRNYMKELRHCYHVHIIQIRGVRKIKLHAVVHLHDSIDCNRSAQQTSI
jgi:hypothetical protein